MFGLSTAEIGGIVRAALAGLGGIVAARGWIDEATWTTITGAVITLGTALWSIVAKRNTVP